MPRILMRGLISLDVLLLFALSCGGRTPRPVALHDKFLQRALYQVVATKTENPFDEIDDCPLTAYIEIGPGKEFGRAEDRLAVLFWLMPNGAINAYTYELRPLRDGRVEGALYVIDEMTSGREWFLIERDEIVEYASDSYVAEDASRIRQRCRLKLKRVARTAALDEKLRQ